MDNIIKKLVSNKVCKYFLNIRLNHTDGNVKYPTNKKNIMDKRKNIHPYRRVHPWSCRDKFIDNMLDHVIYNKDGLVAVNKPYGISARPQDPDVVRKVKLPSGIPFEKNYTISDALPRIAEKLGYDNLTIVKTPERFTTGALLLSANDKITEAIDKSFKRAEGARLIPRTYWAVTRRVPIHKEGERRVAMKAIAGPGPKTSEPHIVKTWSKNERERGDIKILNIQFKTLSTSTYNLASLVEIKSSATRWHAIRLFAATVLMSPILGDRVYGSRAQNVMGKFINVSPFVEAAHAPPTLDADLLQFLKLSPNKSIMIPAHLHLREIFLPWFITKGNDIVITAPPHQEFLWTCQRLQFKYEDKEFVNDCPSILNTNNFDTKLFNSSQCTTIT